MSPFLLLFSHTSKRCYRQVGIGMKILTRRSLFVNIHHRVPTKSAEALHERWQQTPRNAHNQGMIRILIIAQKTDNAATPAAFEAVDTGHGLVFVVGSGNAPEVVADCALAFGPANGFPLQKVVGHELA